MSWSIVEVARHAGVSSRTLRHYDDVGLLPPAYVGANGYRYYDEDALLRLQEVLVLRELGLPLDAIRRILDATSDRTAVLREHQPLHQSPAPGIAPRPEPSPLMGSTRGRSRGLQPPRRVTPTT